MALDIKRVLAAAPRKTPSQPLHELTTLWGESLDAENVLQQHPRPQFARSGYIMLHGLWDYAIVQAGKPLAQASAADSPAVFDGRILVPFSPEAPLSGVGRQLQPGQRLWYRLHFDVGARVLGDAILDGSGTAGDAGRDRLEPGRPKVVKALGKVLAVKQGQRCLLHFDGVDWECRVWLNGRPIARNKGCYLPFAAEIDSTLVAGKNELLVAVDDPSDAGTQLRGKQQLERGGIWYTAQSGIWQPVWLETVPETSVRSLRIDAGAGGDLRIEIATDGPAPAASVALFPRSAPAGDCPVTRFSAKADPGDPCRQVAQLHLDGARPWSPEDPALYAIEIRCGDDKVHSYCAFRTVEVAPDANGTRRFFLNGRPYFLRGVLDQGYWPDGLLTPPDDAALAHDIAAMKAHGFNMLRKHIKAECERWYWHCDRLGMLVWQDVPNGGGAYSAWHTSRRPTLLRSSWTRQRDDTPQGRARLSSADPAMRDEWARTCRTLMLRLRNHPCVAGWTLFNEGWGQFDARANAQRARALDPTRPIDATSGWYDQGCGDFFSVHNYFRPLAAWPDRNAAIPRALLLSEFGGIVFHVAGHSSLDASYGYAAAGSLPEWRRAVLGELARAGSLEAEGLSGYVYTQLSDVEEETNGILSYDRRVDKLADGGTGGNAL